MALSDAERSALLWLRDGTGVDAPAPSVVDRLRQLSPEALFYVPWIIDWDDIDSEELLWWILGAENCDAATAMAMYWLNQSWDWLSVPSKTQPMEYEVRGYNIAAHIQDRMRHYEFPTRALSYDPAWHHLLVYPLTGNVPQHVSRLPEHMRIATPGVPLASDIVLACW